MCWLLWTISPPPEMFSLDLASVMLFSLDLFSALQVCLSGSSSCAHSFNIAIARCLTLHFFSLPVCPAEFLLPCGFRNSLYPQIYLYQTISTEILIVVTTIFLNIIKASLFKLHSFLYLCLFSATVMYV